MNPKSRSISGAVRAAATLACALVLTGCPDGSGAGDAMAGDTLPAPPPVADAQPGVPPGQDVVLAAREGSGVTGAATVMPQGAVTVIAASVQNAPPNAVLPVRLHTGTCADEGVVRTDLEPIRTDARGTGTMQATVELPAHQIMTGQHYIHVFQALDEPNRGLACGDLPARPDLHPGITQP
jgi:hypothetical protein